MASQPHDMNGKNCPSCDKTLTSKSFTGSIRYRETGSNLIIYKKACLDCMEKHYSRGE